MKKLLLLLFSFLLSFSSYGEWTEFLTDKDEILYIDLENFQERSDGYVYYWMMLSDSSKSQKVYVKADCEFESFNVLQIDTHTKTMGGGTVSTSHPERGWIYGAPDTNFYRFLKAICEMVDETLEQRVNSVNNFKMSLEYKNKINNLYEEEVENEEYKPLLEEEIKVDEDLLKSILDEELNTLKSAYVNNIAARVKSFWRYQGAEDDWTAEVYIVQDRDGTIVAVDVRNANVDDSSKAKVFKDSIRRAVYKASPLPSAPDEAVFDRELIFVFGVN